MLSSILSSSILFVLSSGDANPLIRRLNAEETDPTNMPTQNPLATGCIVSYAGDTAPIANPSDYDIGLVSLSASLHDIDFEGGDTFLDANNAKYFCEQTFGVSSEPVFPENEDTFDAMVNLCEAMGNGNECYMGSYRMDYNLLKTDCETWRGQDSTLTVSTADFAAYGTWSGVHNTCDWNTAKHCVSYKTSSNKLLMSPCTSQMTIICRYTENKCTP